MDEDDDEDNDDPCSCLGVDDDEPEKDKALSARTISDEVEVSMGSTPPFFVVDEIAAPDPDIDLGLCADDDEADAFTGLCGVEGLLVEGERAPLCMECKTLELPRS